jgi:hypothetical protein
MDFRFSPRNAEDTLDHIMKLTKHSHIVPIMLLSQFVAPDGMLCVYEKHRQLRRSKPINECTERYFYEFEFRGKKTNNRYEAWLSQIEGNAAAVLEQIKQRRTLTSGEAETWATFVAALFGRTRKVKAQIANAIPQKVRQEIDNPDHVRDLQVALLEHGELRYAEDIHRNLTEMHSAMNADPAYFFVSGLPKRAHIIASDILARDWHTIAAPERHSFLISDCPVVTYKVQNGQILTGVGFGDKATIILLPVSPNHLFVASPRGGGWPTVFSASDMQYVNRMIVHFAHRNVYANAEFEEIQRLVDLEIDSTKFGENAFLPPVR